MTFTDDITEGLRRRGAVDTIRAGIAEAPALGRGLAVTFLLALIGAAGRVTIPVVMQQAIDNGLADGGVRVGYITRLCVVAGVVVLFAAVSQRMAVFRLGSAAEEGLYGLRVRLFDHIHRLSLADHNEERRGALVARVTSDIETLTMFFAWGGLAWMLNLSLMFVVACAMLAYDWVLALVAFAVVAPLIVVLRLVQKRLVRAYDGVRTNNAGMLSLMTETVSGVETLQAYGAVEPALSRVQDATARRSKTSIRAGIIGAFLFPSGEVFSVFTVTAVVGIGVARGEGAGLSAGALVGFMFLTYRFLEPIAEFTEVIDQTQTAVAGLRRVLGILDTPIGPPPPTDPVKLPNGRLGIALNEVSFYYAPREDETSPTNVLSNLTLIIPPTQHVALGGESGSGKTTIARLIARRADPTSGRVVIGGVNLKHVANDDLRRRLTVVPQEPFLFAESIAYNLRFADPLASDEQLQRAVGELGLEEWIATLPDGLDTQVGQRGQALSAGERQMVALLRASLVNPDVLILDEATSSVDALTEVRLARALRKLSKGRTTISIAHRLSTAARADRVILLADGQVVEDGSHEELMVRRGQYSVMYESWLAATRT
ncbi:MAG: ABC transporter ATP-binding protein [Ilumatobacteraceae bacterium]